MLRSVCYFSGAILLTLTGCGLPPDIVGSTDPRIPPVIGTDAGPVAEHAESDDQWRRDATRDLAFIREELVRSSPAPYAGEAGEDFRRWFDSGYKSSSASLAKVNGPRAYIIF
jgi:hypothetical protein